MEFGTAKRSTLGVNALGDDTLLPKKALNHPGLGAWRAALELQGKPIRTLNHVSNHLNMTRHSTSDAACQADHRPFSVAQSADPMKGSLQMHELRPETHLGAHDNLAA